MPFHQVVLQAVSIRRQLVVMPIPVRVEEWVRVPTLVEAMTRKVLDGRQPRNNNVGVPSFVPISVQEIRCPCYNSVGLPDP